MPTYSYTLEDPAAGGSTASDGVSASNIEDIKADIRRQFGTDIFFDSDYAVSSSKDYVLVSGIQALRQAIYHRLITKPGEYAYRPNYGIGIQTYIKKRIITDTIDQIETAVREQLLQERRISSVEQIVVRRIQDGIALHIKIRAAGRALQFKPFNFTKETV